MKDENIDLSYYETHKEQMKKQSTEWNKINRDKCIEYQKKWAEKNNKRWREIKDSLIDDKTEDVTNNKLKTYRQTYYARHREHVLELNRKWRQEHPEQWRKSVNKYRQKRASILKENEQK
jgi:uncharacterized protein YnzC (UPF0291/DUF896 family)